MRLYIKYDINLACKVIVQEQLDNFEVDYNLLEFGEIEIKNPIEETILNNIQNELGRYGIEIINNQKSQLVQKIKNTIVAMIYEKDKLPLSTISSYLADQLKLRLFSKHIFRIYLHIN
jgi:hypothetical protein